MTPDGTILTSYHKHDFVAHVDANGLEYYVDGGTEELYRAVHHDYPYDELSIYDDDDFEVVRESFHWGTRGKKGDQVLKWVPLSHLDTEHIEAILKTQKHLSQSRVVLFNKELEYREALVC